jgi:hypothetical protein
MTPLELVYSAGLLRFAALAFRPPHSRIKEINMTDATNADDDPEFWPWFESISGVKKSKAIDDDLFDHLILSARGTWGLLRNLSLDSARHEQAEALIELMVPAEVDVELWAALATGRNLHLPVSGRFGAVASHLRGTGPAPADPRQASAGSKKNAEPLRQRFDRQGKAVVAATAKIDDLERRLREAKAERAQLDNELKYAAAICLVTQMHKATASIFAVGPAWTILRAIAGTTGQETSENSQARESHLIMTVLHALCAHEPFEQQVKRALLDICKEWKGEAAKRGQPHSEFDGPHNYEHILQHLEWIPKGSDW